MILPVIAALSFCFLPESPVWLVQNGRYDDARKNMMWLQGNDSNKVKGDLQQLISRTEKEQQGNMANDSVWKALFEPAVLKPFLILNLFNIMQILSGTYLVVFYAVDILSTIDGENGEIDTFLAAVLTACVRFIFTILASVLLCIIGRRTLALTSGLGTAITALCLGTFLYLHSPSCTTSSGHFAAICILAYVAANTVGFLILPGVLLGELYPTKIRGFAGGLTFTTFNLVLFAVAKLFPLLKNALGVHGVFWVFGGSSLLASGFLGAILPETQGKSLNEIEDYFNEDHILWMRRRKTQYKKDDSEYIAKLHNNNNV